LRLFVSNKPERNALKLARTRFAVNSSKSSSCEGRFSRISCASCVELVASALTPSTSFDFFLPLDLQLLLHGDDLFGSVTLLDLRT